MTKFDCNKIGIVGGMGPLASVDLARKIIENTITSTDQGHISFILASYPSQIPDRSAFLLGQTQINPADSILKIIHQLKDDGANIIGLPCNTAHAPPIFNKVITDLQKSNSQITIVHMIKAVAEFLKNTYPKIQKLGVLSTNGAYQAKIYPTFLEKAGLEICVPDQKLQHQIHQAIYHPRYGIKAVTSPLSYKAVSTFHQAIDYFAEQNVQAVILGCTEIAVAVPVTTYQNMTIIDPTTILARKLIELSNPLKLKPLSKELTNVNGNHYQKKYQVV